MSRWRPSAATESMRTGGTPSEVRYAQTPQEDVQRRDFTINGLLYDPLLDQVLDYVGGQADIRARRLRTIGDPVERLSEDRLRMLRAVRFTARFDSSWTPLCWRPSANSRRRSIP